MIDLEGPQLEGREWADGGPGWKQRLWEKHDGPADTEAL